MIPQNNFLCRGEGKQEFPTEPSASQTQLVNILSLLSNNLNRQKPGKKAAQSIYCRYGRSYYRISGLWRMYAHNEMGLNESRNVTIFLGFFFFFSFLLMCSTLNFQGSMEKN